MIRDKKIQSGEVSERNVKSVKGNRLTGTVQANKNVFDRLGEFIVERFNALVDELSGLGLDNFNSELGKKADKNSPTFTGTATYYKTVEDGNDREVSNVGYVRSKIAALGATFQNKYDTLSSKVDQKVTEIYSASGAYDIVSKMQYRGQSFLAWLDNTRAELTELTNNVGGLDTRTGKLEKKVTDDVTALKQTDNLHAEQLRGLHEGQEFANGRLGMMDTAIQGMKTDINNKVNQSTLQTKLDETYQRGVEYVGDVTDLNTVDKSDVVSAINEIKANKVDNTEYNTLKQATQLPASSTATIPELFNTEQESSISASLGALLHLYRNKATKAELEQAVETLEEKIRNAQITGGGGSVDLSVYATKKLLEEKATEILGKIGNPDDGDIEQDYKEVLRDKTVLKLIVEAYKADETLRTTIGEANSGVQALKSALPNYATKQYVNGEISNVSDRVGVLEGEKSTYAKKTDVSISANTKMKVENINGGSSYGSLYGNDVDNGISWLATVANRLDTNKASTSELTGVKNDLRNNYVSKSALSIELRDVATKTELSYKANRSEIPTISEATIRKFEQLGFVR